MIYPYLLRFSPLRPSQTRTSETPLEHVATSSINSPLPKKTLKADGQRDRERNREKRKDPVTKVTNQQFQLRTGLDTNPVLLLKVEIEKIQMCCFVGTKKDTCSSLLIRHLITKTATTTKATAAATTTKSNLGRVVLVLNF